MRLLQQLIMLVNLELRLVRLLLGCQKLCRLATAAAVTIVEFLAQPVLFGLLQGIPPSSHLLGPLS